MSITKVIPVPPFYPSIMNGKGGGVEGTTSRKRKLTPLKSTPDSSTLPPPPTAWLSSLPQTNESELKTKVTPTKKTLKSTTTSTVVKQELRKNVKKKKRLRKEKIVSELLREKISKKKKSSLTKKKMKTPKTLSLSIGGGEDSNEEEGGNIFIDVIEESE